MKNRDYTYSGIWAVLACLSTLILWTAAARAAGDPQVGKIVAIRGKAVAMDAQSVTRPLKMKSPVFLNDTIQTRNSRLQVLFQDSTIITLGKNTRLVVEKYLWEPDNPGSAMETRVKEGSFRVMGGAITRAAPENFKTNTPSGTIGIRGSMYAGLVTDTSLEVFFQGGRGIFVTNRFGSVEIRKPGHFTRIKDQFSPPAPPRKAEPKQLMNLENALARVAPEAQEDAPDARPESSGPAPAAAGPQSPDQTLRQGEPAAAAVSLPDKSMESHLISPDIAQPLKPLSHLTPIVVEPPEIKVPDDDVKKLPDTGVWVYAGMIKDQTDPGNPDEKVTLLVNWDNRKIMILGDDPVAQGDPNTEFAFGAVTDTGAVKELQVQGSTGDPNTFNIYAITGTDAMGQIMGNDFDEVALVLETVETNLTDPTDQNGWKGEIKAKLISKSPNPSKGQEVWKGFFVGVAEDMAAPHLDRQIFTNTSADAFAFLVDKDKGTLSGTMSGTDFNNNANTITGLTIGQGGPNDPGLKSVYAADDLMGALLYGQDTIHMGADTSGVKPSGNYLRSAAEPPMSAYSQWGYWETAYKDPSNGKDYHIHVPGAFWVAGLPTPPNAVSKRLNTPFSGTYTGGAQGIVIDGTGKLSKLMNGKTSLLVNFSSNASTPVSGSIDFTGHSLAVTSPPGAVSPYGFSAKIAGASKSQVSGTFYGPDVNGIGGNFSADLSGNQYHGIFAGDR